MTNEEAIYKLKNECAKMSGYCECDGTCEHGCHIYMAIEALEKQIPEKPMRIGLCSCNYAVDSTMRYCKNCGQRIDWSE